MHWWVISDWNYRGKTGWKQLLSSTTKSIDKRKAEASEKKWSSGEPMTEAVSWTALLKRVNQGCLFVRTVIWTVFCCWFETEHCLSETFSGLKVEAKMQPLKAKTLSQLKPQSYRITITNLKLWKTCSDCLLERFLSSSSQATESQSQISNSGKHAATEI